MSAHNANLLPYWKSLSLTDEERKTLASGKKINTIKMVRERTGMSLLDSKNLVESHERNPIYKVVSPDQHAWIVSTYRELLIALAHRQDIPFDELAQTAMDLTEKALGVMDEFDQKLAGLGELARDKG